MARMIPSVVSPSCPSPGEVEIFRRFRDDPATRDWVVLHSLNVAKHIRQVEGEIDFVVLVPSKGVLCLEVKATRSVRRENGRWYYGNSNDGDPRGPFRQASEGMHSIRERIVARRPDLGRVVFWSAVAFPYVPFGIESGEWHKWQVIDGPRFRSRPLSDVVLHILDRAREHLAQSPTAAWFRPESAEPYPQQCEAIAKMLRPDFEVFESPRSRMERLGTELKKFTEDQFAALDMMEENQRVLFSGPAGTGKTLLAIEAANRGVSHGRRVLFLCFNRNLGDWLSAQFGGQHDRLTVARLHQHMLKLSGAAVPSDAGTSFWTRELPLAACDALITVQREQDFYDELLIDEAQDLLRGEYLDFLDLSLRGGLGSGRASMFGDFEKQAIYGADSLTLEQAMDQHLRGWTRFKLRTNCRNRPRIAELVEALAGLQPGYSKVLLPDDGVQPDLVYYDTEAGQVEELTRTIDRLMAEGLKRDEIIVLSSSTRSAAAALHETHEWRDRLAPYDSGRAGRTAYSTVQAFKGLESPAVILTDITRYGDVASQALFYVGITRALHRLVVLAHRSVKAGFRKAVLDGGTGGTRSGHDDPQ